ncbi:NAD(P)/FAD-dependent oxidoreductase [Rhodococcus sp. JS3073]|uniref:NAD(P)/FAD-dependent oxidoreductase n=1 Tax=Rhodococcus sp. JS3073 TaxID=3002901 RepID=UPI00228685C3|nr:FAD-dependent oxidoreductase [Rhodococcus sp. JS3073]WAM19947.1 FAD-dependent oxidoreductase [Rhodococcus sp. JS3073]
MSPAGVVVVGASAAGIAAAEAARRAGFDGPITIIGDEPHPPYTRPALSKALLCGTEPAESVHLPRPEDGIDFLPGRAIGLDIKRKRVTLSGGGALEYSGVVIASGARARQLRPDGAGETVLRSLDDAVRLREEIRGAHSALVIGGGFVGTEVASACVAAGLETTVVSRHDTLVPHLGADLSDLITRAAINAGVVLEPAPQQIRLTGPDRVTGLALSDHLTLEADVVVTAVGCRPNIEWLSDSGLDLIDGVVVDKYCRATAEVVAAGDVTRVRGARVLAPRTPFWTAALEQARIAGQSLVRGTSASPYVSAPFYWTEAFGLAIAISGPIPASGECETLAGDLRAGTGLFRWRNQHGVTVAAVNHRIAVRKLRALSRESE